MAPFLKEIKKRIPHSFFECTAPLFVPGNDGASDESVRIKMRVSACFPIRVSSSESIARYIANCESKTGLLPKRYLDLAECHDERVPSIALQSVAEFMGSERALASLYR